MGQSLAVKYRPTSLTEVCGQQSIVKILTTQARNKVLSNAYLFCGGSGVGKTTIARAFASLINDGVGTPIEIDAASHNGVDAVRALIQSASERALDCEYKVIILDECHALTSQAWQVLLKVLEEPSEFTIFVFCTTDPQKIPTTIINRVQRFNFQRLSLDIVKQRLAYICEQEGYTEYQDAVEYIAKLSEGGMRDAIARLEKAASYNPQLTMANVMEALGGSSYDELFSFVDSFVDGKDAELLSFIEAYHFGGGDIRAFVDRLLEFVLDLGKYSLFQDCATTKIPKTYEDRLRFTTGFRDSLQYFVWLTDKLLAIKNAIKKDASPKVTFEAMVLTACRMPG